VKTVLHSWSTLIFSPDTSTVLLERGETLAWPHAAMACAAIAGGLWIMGAALQGQLGILRVLLWNTPVVAALWWAFV